MGWKWSGAHKRSPGSWKTGKGVFFGVRITQKLSAEEGRLRAWLSKNVPWNHPEASKNFGGLIYARSCRQEDDTVPSPDKLHACKGRREREVLISFIVVGVAVKRRRKREVRVWNRNAEEGGWEQKRDRRTFTFHSQRSYAGRWMVVKVGAIPKYAR